MKRFIKALYSNKILAFFMMLIQIVILAAGYIWLSDYATYFFGASTLLSIALAAYEMNRDDSPEFKMTWLVLVGVIPIFGALLYIYLRIGFLSKHIAVQHKEERDKLSKNIRIDAEAVKNIITSEPEIKGLSYYLMNNEYAPPYSNCDLKYYDLGEKMYKDIIDAMENAKKYIFIEFFIVNFSSSIWTEMFDIMSRKVREGVEVRFMYDGMGSLISLPRNFSAILDSAGIKHIAFAPVQPLLSTYQNNRDHRKIIVVDGEVAFTGGINIADEYVNRIIRFGHWKDNGIRIQGAAVSRLAIMFLEMWRTAGEDKTDAESYITMPEPMEHNGYVIPYGDCPMDDRASGKRAYIDIINNAREYVYIMTPYLIPDAEIMDTLKYAVSRGVDIKIIIPHHPDKAYAYWLAHTYFPELIRGGVEIYEYTPGFIHAKTVVSDDTKAVVGTINFDFRSFFLHYECAVLMYKTDIIPEIKNDFISTCDKSQKITMIEYKKFNILTRFLGRMIRIVAPLL